VPNAKRIYGLPFGRDGEAMGAISKFTAYWEFQHEHQESTVVVIVIGVCCIVGYQL
jgi:hypothetical protein